ncbi:MAG: hypothetical protein ACI4TB_01820 [Lachnospiraceae bacterium]
MTDTERILQQMQENSLAINQRLDRMESKIDSLENRFDSLENRFDKLEKRVDDLEIGLECEIEKVYRIAQKNSEDIQLLLPYKDKIINVSTVVDRVSSKRMILLL